MPTDQTPETAPQPADDASRDLERVDRFQEILRDFGHFTAASVALDRLLDHAARLLSRAIGVKHVKVMRYRPEMGDLLIIAGVGWKPGVVGECRMAIDVASPPGRTLQTRQSICVDDLPAADGYRYAPVLQEHGIISLLNAPIPVGGSTWGVIEADSEERAHFNRRDLVFVETFACQLGTAIRHIETARELAEKAETAARSLSERELLAREEHHRIKNYFQSILAMLNMKAVGAGTDDAKRAFREVMDRVMSISLVHDLLVPRGGPPRLGAADYVKALCAAVERTHEDARFEIEAEHADLRADQAVPLGLILNELLTNTVKYALSSNPDEPVRVGFQVAAGDEAVLRVADHGPGMPPDPREGSAGLGLVRALARQLGGAVEIESGGGGTTVTVRFPLIM